MKGITHFFNGVAAATFFPAAVQASVNDKSWIFLIAGAMAISADTFDFRVSRYMHKADYEAGLDPETLDPQPVANMIAKAINEAHATRKTVNMKLHTLKVSANYYRTYSIFFDNKTNEVEVEVGMVKSLGQTMGGGGDGKPGTAPTKNNKARAKLNAHILDAYEAKTQVAIFSGPDFAFVPLEKGVKADFIPWHRTWAHSIPLGLLMGLVALACYVNWSALGNSGQSFFTPFSLTAFFVGLTAFMAHIANDQCGHLGNQLFYPFGDRMKGLGFTSSAAPVANILANYLSFAVILFNLNAFSGAPVFKVPFTSGLTGDFTTLGYYFASFAIYFVLFILLPSYLFTLGIKLWGHLTAEEVDEASSEGEDQIGDLTTD